MKNVRKIVVFVSSPSDVKKERDCLTRVIRSLNRTLGKDKDCMLELFRCEEDVAPDMGRPQEVVNRQIGDYDIFLGIMWRRFGTPTGEAGSGTEEEFNNAYENWQAKGSPRIMFYFNQAAYNPKTPDDAQQPLKVKQFHEKIKSLGLGYTPEYNGAAEFERKIRDDLYAAVSDLLAEQDGSAESGVAPDKTELPPHLRTTLQSWRDSPHLFLLLKEIIDGGPRTFAELLSFGDRFLVPNHLHSFLKTLLDAGILVGSPQSFKMPDTTRVAIGAWLERNTVPLRRVERLLLDAANPRRRGPGLDACLLDDAVAGLSF